MKLNIQLKGNCSIDIGEDELNEIVQKFDGCCGNYMKQLHIDNSKIEWTIEDSEHDVSKLESALIDFQLTKGTIKHGLNTFYKMKLNKYLFMDSIVQLKNLHEDNNLIEFSYNKIDLFKVFNYADEHNPRKELNFVYFNEDYILATNTKILICNKNHSSHYDIYIPKMFCEAYHTFDDAKIFYEKEQGLVYLLLNGKIYKDEFKDFKFIDYKKIIPDTFNTTLKTIDFIANSKTLLLDEKDRIRAFAYKLTNRYSCIDNKNLEDRYLCAYLNLDFGLENAGINDYHLPFALYDDKKENMQIVMPLLLSNYEVYNHLDEKED